MYNFLIELLRSRDYPKYDCHEIVNLMDKLPHPPDDHQIVEDGVVAARFFYQQWPNVLDTIVFLWEVVLDDPKVKFTPKLFRNLVVPSDIDELNSKVRVLFKDKVIGLKEGDLLRGLGERVEALAGKIMELEWSLKKTMSFAVYAELKKKKEGFLRDQDLIRRKIEDFKWAMECVIDYLDGRVLSFYDVRALNLKGEFDWNQLYSVINRECRTLKDGLHIFADHTDQVFAFFLKAFDTSHYLISNT